MHDLLVGHQQVMHHIQDSEFFQPTHGGGGWLASWLAVHLPSHGGGGWLAVHLPSHGGGGWLAGWPSTYPPTVVVVVKERWRCEEALEV